jgi:hypothetical protein
MTFFMPISNSTRKTPISEMENNMVSNKRLKTLCLFAASATILLVAGCHPTSESDTATSSAEINESHTLFHTQEVAGARAECTLYSNAFDGPTLTSLGTRTLDLILEDSHSCNPLIVYMAVPEMDKNAEERRLAVGRYLEDRGGLKSEQIEFRAGSNPATYSPAAVGVNNYAKTDTASDNPSATIGASH